MRAFFINCDVTWSLYREITQCRPGVTWLLWTWHPLQGCQDFMRCEESLRAAGEVNQMLYILYYYLLYYVKLIEGPGGCSGSFWQIWYVLVGSCVLHLAWGRYITQNCLQSLPCHDHPWLGRSQRQPHNCTAWQPWALHATS